MRQKERALWGIETKLSKAVELQKRNATVLRNPFKIVQYPTLKITEPATPRFLSQLALAADGTKKFITPLFFPFGFFRMGFIDSEDSSILVSLLIEDFLYAHFITRLNCL